MINFSNTIAGGWNQATPKLKVPTLPQRLHRQNSQQQQTPQSNSNTVGNFVNFSQTNTRFFSELNIPKIPTRAFASPVVQQQVKNQSSEPISKVQEITNNNSQTFSQPNKSHYEKTKHISSTNYTNSTEALYETDNNNNYKTKIKDEYILSSFQKSSLPTTKGESPMSNKNHKKKKLDEAKKQAEFFDDNKIKQFRFAQADEDEEMNFRELCNAFQTLN